MPCAATTRCTGLALTVANRVPTLVRLANGATLPAVCALAGPGACVVVATVTAPVPSSSTATRTVTVRAGR